jgi:2,5-diketo-D-gluconate reductase A
MADQPILALNDGRRIPQLGLGVWQISDDAVADVALQAMQVGYRMIDTAAIYRNETGVGRAFAAAPVAREQMFLTTKLWNDMQGFDSALRACDESLQRLGQDYVDLYLIHWPVPPRNRYLDSWRALIRVREEGRAKSIGVSNFGVAELERIIGETGVVPAVNQVELHPSFQQRALRAFHEKHGIRTQSWSPLGVGAALKDPVITRLAEMYGKTAAQIVIRWHLEHGLIVIPKTQTPARLAENFDVFDFSLRPQDVAVIDARDDARGRVGPDPQTFG